MVNEWIRFESKIKEKFEFARGINLVWNSRNIHQFLFFETK